MRISQPALQHIEKGALIPPIIIGFAGGDLTRPVVTKRHAAMLPLHVLAMLDLFSPLVRIAFVGDGRIFGGQSKGVPAHGMQHVIAAHPLVACERITDGVIANMADVKRAAGIREHLEHVELGLRGVVFDLIQAGFVLPALEPFQFDAVYGRRASRAWRAGISG